MTTEQVAKWCADVLALIDAGEMDVDTIIAKRGGARMSTLVAIQGLIDSDTIIRAGNTVWRPGKRTFNFNSPF